MVESWLTLHKHLPQRFLRNPILLLKVSSKTEAAFNDSFCNSNRRSVPIDLPFFTGYKFSRALAAFTHVLYILPKFGVYNQMRKLEPRVTRFKMAASCELWILWNHCCFPFSDASGTQIALIVLPDCINCSSRRTKVNDIFNCAFSAFRIALIQLAVSSNKAQNLLRAKDKIKEAVSKGAKIVALPVSMILPVFTWRN